MQDLETTTMSQPELDPLPPSFVELKQEIASTFPDFERRVTAAWADILKELKTATDEIIVRGSDVRAACSIFHYSDSLIITFSRSFLK